MEAMIESIQRLDEDSSIVFQSAGNINLGLADDLNLWGDTITIFNQNGNFSQQVLTNYRFRVDNLNIENPELSLHWGWSRRSDRNSFQSSASVVQYSSVVPEPSFYALVMGLDKLQEKFHCGRASASIFRIVSSDFSTCS